MYHSSSTPILNVEYSCVSFLVLGLQSVLLIVHLTAFLLHLVVWISLRLLIVGLLIILGLLITASLLMSACDKSANHNTEIIICGLVLIILLAV